MTRVQHTFVRYITLTMLFIYWIFPTNALAFSEIELPIFGQDSVEKTAANKSINDILGLANKYSFKDMKISLMYANIALKKAQKNGVLTEVFDVQRDFGFIYEDNALFKEALKSYEAAAKTAVQLNDSARLTINTDLAIINRKLGNYRAAYDYHDKNLNLALKINNIEAIEESYHGLGYLLKDVGVYDKAIDFYLKSLRLAEQRQYQDFIIVSHNEIAATYLKAKVFDQALSHIKEAYSIALKEQKKHDNDEKFAAFVASSANIYGEILDSRNLRRQMPFTNPSITSHI
jgi:tetratricopeptide (TPR) repeat protein